MSGSTPRQAARWRHTRFFMRLNSHPRIRVTVPVGERHIPNPAERYARRKALSLVDQGQDVHTNKPVRSPSDPREVTLWGPRAGTTPRGGLIRTASAERPLA